MLLYGILAGLFALLFISWFIWRRIQKKRQQAMEERTAAFIDNFALKRTTINTKYMEQDFYDLMQRIVMGNYTLNPNVVDAKALVPKFYQDWYNRLLREYSAGVRRQLFGLQMYGPRVTKQDNSSIYGVSHIYTEAVFDVTALYQHPTEERQIAKRFRQKFTFVNTNEGGWLLEYAGPEEPVR